MPINRNLEDYAGMVELVDTRDLKSRGPCARVGSTPTLAPINKGFQGFTP